MDKYVYLTNKGEKYHTDNECRHLYGKTYITYHGKKYIFDGCYFLSKIKIKYKYELKDTISLGKLIPTQIKVNPDTKNEIKKLVTLVEDFINELIESK